MGGADYESEPGTERVQLTRQFQNIVVIASLAEGLIVATAQDRLEKWLEPIIDAYLGRPRLEIEANGLSGVLQQTVVDDDVEPQEFYQTEWLVLVITHEIIYRKTVAFITS